MALIGVVPRNGLILQELDLCLLLFLLVVVDTSVHDEDPYESNTRTDVRALT